MYHKIIVTANGNENFSYDDGISDDPSKLSIQAGDTVSWLCQVPKANGKMAHIAANIVFASGSPFLNVTTILVPGDGNFSNAATVNQGKEGDALKYSVILPSVGLSHDPEILIDATKLNGRGQLEFPGRLKVIITKAAGSLYFYPDGPVDISGKRVFWLSAGGPYSIVFDPINWPFVSPYQPQIKSQPGGCTSALLAVLGTGKTITYRYLVTFSDGSVFPGPGVQIT
jgi:hypothetical protein